MEQPTVRPTLRTLHALNIKLPDAYTSLADLEHPVVVKSQSVPIQVHAGGGERFLAITDRLWWKVKVNRWRAAVVNASGEDSWWIGMAGLREDGSKTDFYAKHANLFKRHGNSEPWLPQVDDYKREAIEKHLTYWPKLRKMLERALVRSTYQPNGVAVGVTLNDNGRIGYLVEVHDELLLVGCVIEHTVNYRIGATVFLSGKTVCSKRAPGTHLASLQKCSITPSSSAHLRLANARTRNTPTANELTT